MREGKEKGKRKEEERRRWKTSCCAHLLGTTKKKERKKNKKKQKQPEEAKKKKSMNHNPEKNNFCRHPAGSILAPQFFLCGFCTYSPGPKPRKPPSDLCTFDLAIGLFVFLGYFFFLFLLISPHCGYFFFLLSLGSWVFMVNFPSKWMLFCLHSNS